MKNQLCQPLLIIILLFITSFGFSQEKKMLDHDNVWVYGPLWVTSYGLDHEIYKTQGDTVINDKVYTKIKNKKYNAELMEYYHTSFFFLREEAGVVYSPSQGDEDGIIYNFNLNLLDTFTQAYPDNRKYVVTDTSTFISLDNVSRRQLCLTDISDFNQKLDDVWIEGIGSLNTFIPKFNFQEYDTLYCHSTGDFDKVITEDWVCDNISTSVNDLVIDDNFISLYPQPATETLTINTHNTDVSQLTVTDLYGRAVESIFLQSSYEYYLDVVNLMDGIYHLQIRYADGTSSSSLFIVQK